MGGIRVFRKQHTAYREIPSERSERQTHPYFLATISPFGLVTMIAMRLW
jgi:hypothetical protein